MQTIDDTTVVSDPVAAAKQAMEEIAAAITLLDKAVVGLGERHSPQEYTDLLVGIDSLRKQLGIVSDDVAHSAFTAAAETYDASVKAGEWVYVNTPAGPRVLVPSSGTRDVDNTKAWPAIRRSLLSPSANEDGEAVYPDAEEVLDQVAALYGIVGQTGKPAKSKLPGKRILRGMFGAEARHFMAWKPAARSAAKLVPPTSLTKKPRPLPTEDTDEEEFDD